MPNTTNRRNLIKTAATVLTGAPLAAAASTTNVSRLEAFTFAPPPITQAEMASVRDAQLYIDRMILSFARRLKRRCHRGTWPNLDRHG